MSKGLRFFTVGSLLEEAWLSIVEDEFDAWEVGVFTVAAWGVSAVAGLVGLEEVLDPTGFSGFLWVLDVSGLAGIRELVLFCLVWVIGVVDATGLGGVAVWAVLPGIVEIIELADFTEVVLFGEGEGGCFTDEVRLAGFSGFALVVKVAGWGVGVAGVDVVDGVVRAAGVVEPGSLFGAVGTLCLDGVVDADEFVGLGGPTGVVGIDNVAGVAAVIGLDGLTREELEEGVAGVGGVLELFVFSEMVLFNKTDFGVTDELVGITNLGGIEEEIVVAVGDVGLACFKEAGSRVAKGFGWVGGDAALGGLLRGLVGIGLVDGAVWLCTTWAADSDFFGSLVKVGTGVTGTRTVDVSEVVEATVSCFTGVRGVAAVTGSTDATGELTGRDSETALDWGGLFPEVTCVTDDWGLIDDGTKLFVEINGSLG